MYEGRLVRLRPFEREDAERYRAFVNDREIARLVDRAGPVSRAEHERWYEHLVASDSTAVFTVERLRDRRFLGAAWLHGIQWRHRRAEVRIVLGARRGLGRGAGTDALRVLATFAFGPLDLEKLWAEVLSTNPRALGAFEKAGFRREGLLRADRVTEEGRVDVVRLGLLRGEARAGRS